MTIILDITLTVLFTIILINIFIPLSHRFGLIDRPGGHKSHNGEVPVVGGLAMFFSFILAACLVSIQIPGYLALLTGVTILVLVGTLDDLHELTPVKRFVAQIGTAAIMCVWGGIYLSDLGNLLGNWNLSLGILAYPVTIFAAVGVINALNMSDGIDGQAGSISLITIGSVCVIVWNVNQPSTITYILLLASVILAFLVFNLRLFGRGKALIFMGDAGSMFLGFSFAWLLILLTQGENRVMQPVIALWIFALPLMDTITVMISRSIKGRRPTSPDNTHYHHLLLAAGLNVNQSLAVIITVSSTLASIGLLGHFYHWPDSLMFYGFVLLFLFYFALNSSTATKSMIRSRMKKSPAL